jgi:ADP-ribosylglycohydrolase
MKEIFLWGLAALFAAGFFAANYANLQLLRGKYGRPDGTNPSPVLFVGGILGVLACLAAPDETLRNYWWVPLVLDLGTGPYLVYVAILLVAGALSYSQSGPAAAAPAGTMPEPAVAPDPFPKRRAIIGCILGTAVGDALGLACEGLSRGRQLRMFPGLNGYKLLPFGKGMCSDDTEHTCMLAQSLITLHPSTHDDIEKLTGALASSFAWRLRFWLLGLPAGIGLATLRAILKLWIGFPARASGVFSAGNGPAMRVAVLGVCYGDDLPRLRALVRAATRITHTDPKAEHGALAVALAAHLAGAGTNVTPLDFASRLRALLGEDGKALLDLVDHVARSVEAKESAADYMARNGCADGVSGYIFHTVPAALHVWLAHQNDYRGGVAAMVRLGGDSDTSAAIVGAIIGARVGKEGIPPEWLRDLWEWPRTPSWLERLGNRLAEHASYGGGQAIDLNPLALLLRNVLFIPLVLAHGFRRLLPPY